MVVSRFCPAAVVGEPAEVAEHVWEKVTELAGLDLPSLWPAANAAPSFTEDLEGNICRAEPAEAEVAVR